VKINFPLGKLILCKVVAKIRINLANIRLFFTKNTYSNYKIDKN